ncbi:TPA: Arm DNA-binding domain-containing protein [Salmonella enterica subsp. enterica serovar Charity]
MSLSDAKIRSIKPSDKPFKLTDSQGLYLLVNPGLWVRRSRSVKCGAMFSPSGAFPDVEAIIGDRSPAMVMKLAAQ